MDFHLCRDCFAVYQISRSRRDHRGARPDMASDLRPGPKAPRSGNLLLLVCSEDYSRGVIDLFEKKNASLVAPGNSVLLLSTFVCLCSFPAPALAAGDKFAPVEKQLTSARGAQESERYLQAERMLKKVTVAAEKLLSDSSSQPDSTSTPAPKPTDSNGGSAPGPGSNSSVNGSPASSTAAVEPATDDPATRATKICDDAYCMLGDCSLKLQKYSEAQGAFKRALELEQSKGMLLRANDKLRELDNVYRTVNIEQALGDKASDVVKEAGIKNAFVVKKGDGESINVELGARYNRKIDQTDQVKDAANATSASSGAPAGEKKNQLKQIRIDPKVSFDFVQQPDGIKLSNIQGLSADVGLWVKLMEVELLKGAQGALPKARVTAGKMGIQKTVDLEVPDKVYDQVRSGIEKLDPFINLVRSVIQGAPAMAAPAADAPQSNSDLTAPVVTPPSPPPVPQ